MSDRKRDGIDATSDEFWDYDQVEKPQAYHLAEGEHAEEFDEEFEIQTCDVGRFLQGDADDRAAFAQELGAALHDIGFAILEGHGVEPAVHEDAAQAVRRLFTEHPHEEKLRFRARRFGSVNQGYFPIEETSDIHPDQVEGWVICRRGFDLEDGRAERPRLDEFWPDPEIEPTLRRVYQAQEKLLLPIMQSILIYLGCDPHLYDERLTDTNFALRLNYYPPMTAGQAPGGAGRLLGHEDIDMFTLLPAPELEGLQVLNRRNGRWVRLQAPPGTIILNTGDYMQRITNDILPSTTHRVSQPRDPELCRRDRLSFPMNVYLWEDEMLEVLPGLEDPKYEPVRAIEFHTKTTSKYYGDDYAVTD